MHESIDWFSWLSKTTLDPSLIYEYGIAFSRNELEEADIVYFNHEFLQSMGITIAKHRLEILKLARKQKRSSNTSHPISKFIFAIKKTKTTLASYIRKWVHHDGSGLVLVSKACGSRWKGNMLRRNRRFVTFRQTTAAAAATNTALLLTNGCNKATSVRYNSFSSPLGYDIRYDQEKKDSGIRDDHMSYHEDDGVQDFKWDTMFQDLKPT